MLRLFVAAFLLAIITSCTSNETYYLRADNAEGVTAGATVYRQGVAVGEVLEVSFDEDDVLIEISIEEPLYEDQNFDLRIDASGEPAVELDRPDKDANELVPGSTLEQSTFGRWFGEDVDVSITRNLEEAGENLERSLEDVFGKGGEKLEREMEEIFGRDGKKIKDAVEKVFGQNGEKLERSLEELFGENGEKLEKYAEQFGQQFEELGEELERLEKKYGKDTPEFKKAVKKALRDWADSTN